MRPYLATGATFLLAMLAGCATPAEQKAEQGLAAFQNCDLRGASQAFEDAHDLDGSRADFALAYALSSLAVLPEDPAVTAVLTRLGFDGPIDTSKFWGRGGVIDRLAAHDATCDSVWNQVRTSIPYAAAQQNGPSAASIVRDRTLSGDDFVAAAAALSPRLKKLAGALEQGADGMGEMDIQGGCGVGTVHIERPELYALAAALEAVRASVQAAQAYDWGLNAQLVLDTSGREQEYADALDAHLFHLRDGAAASSALPIAIHSVELVQRAVAAAASITSRPANSLFDWTRLPAGVLSDAQTLSDTAHQMLTAPGQQSLPFFSPGLAIDALSFFDSPPDLAGISPPVWSAVTWHDNFGQSGIQLQSSSQGADPQIGPRFSPDPLAKGAPSYSFGLSDRWRHISSDARLAAFDPDRRWEGRYGCSN